MQKLLLLAVAAAGIITLTTAGEQTQYLHGIWRGGRAVLIKLSDPRNISEYIDDEEGLHVYGIKRQSFPPDQWSAEEITIRGAVKDPEKAAYTVGTLMGGSPDIWYFYSNVLKNYCDNKKDLCAKVNAFLNANVLFIENGIAQYSNKDPFWYHVKLYYIQVIGLWEGYSRFMNKHAEFLLTLRDFLWLQMLRELRDIELAVSAPDEVPEDMVFGDSGSAMVKILPDLSDVIIGHTTWAGYNTMNRVLRVLSIPFPRSHKHPWVMRGHSMAYTSYPGVIGSLDHFYIASSGIVGAGDDIYNTNMTRQIQAVRPDSVLSHVANMVSFRLSNHASQWAHFMFQGRPFSGKEWLLFDFKRFQPKKGSRPGLLDYNSIYYTGITALSIVNIEETIRFLTKSYKATWNIPLEKMQWNKTGGNERVKKYGEWFLSDKHPRAQMLHRGSKTVKDVQSMFDLLRYNDFMNDPLAACNCTPPYSGANAISARCDLNDPNGTYPFEALRFRTHGGIDAKVTNSSLREDYEYLANCGPTHNVANGIPVFKWSESPLNDIVPHEGQPDAFNFKPRIQRWDFV